MASKRAVFLTKSNSEVLVACRPDVIFKTSFYFDLYNAPYDSFV